MGNLNIKSKYKMITKTKKSFHTIQKISLFCICVALFSSCSSYKFEEISLSPYPQLKLKGKVKQVNANVKSYFVHKNNDTIFTNHQFELLFDKKKRLIQQNYIHSKTDRIDVSKFFYDKQGLHTKTEYSNNKDSVIFGEIYRYDPNGFLIEIRDLDAQVKLIRKNDAKGNPVEIIYPNHDYTVKEIFTNDYKNRTVKYQSIDKTGVPDYDFYELRYFDEKGREIKHQHSDSKAYNITEYDKMGYITKKEKVDENGNPKTENYKNSYDNKGNILKREMLNCNKRCETITYEYFFYDKQ
jgi:hypothetical protein